MVGNFKMGLRKGDQAGHRSQSCQSGWRATHGLRLTLEPLERRRLLDAGPLLIGELLAGTAQLGEDVQTPLHQSDVYLATEVPAVVPVARSGLPSTPDLEAATMEPQVVGRYVFYNHSAFDGGDPNANADDDLAIATDKTALLPGQTATRANYTSYSRGINGVIVDIAHPADTIAPDDFSFRVGNDNDPSTWAKAPPPSDVRVREGAGTGGSDRVTFVWDDHAIENQWLQVTVLSANLGLAADDVFYFGNAVAETGDSPSHARVTVSDLLLTRNHAGSFSDPVRIASPYDHNRDQRVDTTDLLLVRNHQAGLLTELDLIRPPEAAPAASQTTGYPWGETGTGTFATKRSLSTSEWVIGFSAGTDPSRFTSVLDKGNLKPAGHVADAYIWQSPLAADLASLDEALGRLENVDFVYPLLPRPRELRWPNDPLFDNQWHLNNTGQTGGTAGADANVLPVWNWGSGTLGAGVVIGIVDDGLQHTHPDLADRYRADLSYDFNDRDADPSPGSWDDHGTSVAGVAAATGNNGVGVSGAAPRAELAGLRLIAGWPTDQDEADALTFKNQQIDVYSNSWGAPDAADNLEAPGRLTLAAMANGVAGGRGGLGSIYVFAGGNGLKYGDNVNYDGYANSRYTIAVAAIDEDGVQSSYSEPGAPILVAAYSSGDREGITTTDLRGSAGYAAGDYTNDFGGTSSAAPLVSGVIALMLQANPNLSWRDVQHVLVQSAEQNDPGDADWTTNGAGHLVNHKYGFGAIDAQRAVNMATGWTNVGPELSTTSGLIQVGAAIPDDSATGVRSTFTVDENFNVEWVEVVLNATHTRRGDLEIVLTSPSGTESILAEEHDDRSSHYNGWVFTSARHWDESSQGDWTLLVRDVASRSTGTFDSWQLNVYGTSGVDTTRPTITGFWPAPGAMVPGTATDVDVTFSEPIQGLDATDLQLGGAAAASAIVGEPVLQGGRTWRFAISGLSDGTLDLSLAPDADDVEDLAGNDLDPSPTVWSYTVDTSAPLPGGIQGTKFNDRDGDGVRGGDEPAMPGVTIYLDLNDNGQLDPGEPSTMTRADDPATADIDEAGTYQFTHLTPGDYVVAEVVPEGYEQTVPPGVPGTGRLSFVEMIKDGSGGVDGLEGAVSLAVSPDGAHVYATGRLDDAVAVFHRASVNGELTFVQVLKDGQFAVDGLDGARSVAISPDGRHVYVAGELEDAVTVFRREELFGTLSFLETLKDGQNGIDGLDGVKSVVVSPDGGHVYAASSEDDAVTVFRRDAASGQLTLVEMLKDGQGGIDSLDGAYGLTVSSDGNYVYATGYADETVVVFRRDASTGALTWVQTLEEGVGGVDGLYLPVAVTLSPDGGNVYATGHWENAVAVFGRDPLSGELTFLQTLKDGAGNVQGLEGAYGMAVSPDGAHLYVTGMRDNALVFFDRDALDGQLTFNEVLRDGQGGVDGLGQARGVSLSPDGRHVYVAGYQDGAVAVFGRDGLRPGTHRVTVPSGQTVEGVDFGSHSVVPMPGEIRGSKFHDLDASGTWDEGEPGLEGWTVFLDQNNNGLLDEEPHTLDSTDVPVPIESESTTTSHLTIAGLTGQVTDVNLTFDLSHTYDGDLSVHLVSPRGTRVLLFAHVGEDGSGFSGTTLDDEAATAITSGSAPFAGSFRPEETLADFDGEDPNGTWSLEVSDDFSLDEGTLNGWSLTITVGEPSAVTDPGGDYVFTGLMPGTYTIAEQQRGGWAQTFPAGAHTVTLGSDQVLEGVDFGNHAVTSVTVTAGDGAAQEEGLQPGEFLVARTGPTDSPLVVHYTVGGTAVGGLDYRPLTMSVTIPPGAASASIPLTPIDDYQPEGPETVEVTIGEGPDYAVGSPATATLTIEDNDSGEPATIRGSVFNDLSGDGIRDGQEPGLENRVVFLDFSEDGVHGDLVHTFAATQLPMPIEDEATIASDLNVGGLTGRIADVNVTLDASHSYIGDLSAFLISPAGTRVKLFGALSSDGEEFSGTTLDDEAAAPIFSADAPFAGSFQPQGSLADFDGEDPNGRWTLEISDNYYLDEGTLHAWSLTISVPEPMAQTDANGDYELTGLSPGTYLVTQQRRPGWRQTAPAQGHRVTVGPGETVEGIDFANQAVQLGEVTIAATQAVAEEDGTPAGEFQVTRTGWTDAPLTVHYTIGGTAINGTDYQPLAASVLIPSGASSVTIPLLPVDDDEPENAETVQLTLIDDPNYTLGAANAATVTIAANDIGEAAAIRGTVFHDLDGDAARDADEPPLEGWTIFLDENNNGQLDEVGRSFSSTDVPKAIADWTTVTSNLTVSGLSEPVADVNVTLMINHTYDGDLWADLISPQRTRVTLFAYVGGSGMNFLNTTLDDEAATAITWGIPPFLGSHAPAGRLADFDGEDPNGVWQLEIGDEGTGDTGVLLSWSLSIGSREPWTTTAADGGYVFGGLSPGAYVVAEEPQPGWWQTFPTGHHTVVARLREITEGVDFGNASPTIRGSKFHDQDGDGAWDEGEPGLEGWTIFLDQDRDGLRDDGTTTVASANVPMTIPDNATATSYLIVSGLSGRITDLDVTLDISHTWDDDLRAELIGPDGTRVRLFTYVGGDGMDFANTTLDDEADTPIEWGVAPLAGSFRPEQPLSVFDGYNPNGRWMLEIADDYAGDEGTLNGWSLAVTAAEIATTTDADGNYALSGLTPGTCVIAEEPRPGWTQTYPDRDHTFVLGPDAIVADVHFGNRRDTRVVGRHVFYNHSSFDGNDAGPNAADGNAIAPDKVALLPGETATSANYTSYHRGINGLIIDVLQPAGPITVDDFRFRMGNDDDPSRWTPAPTPRTVTTEQGAGAEGADRVTIIWDDDTIADRWLEVTVRAENTGLLHDDVFYFGNAVAEAGNSPHDAHVSTIDLLLARNNPRTFLEPAGLDFLYDYNRDGRVNATDVLLARNHQTDFLEALKLVDLSV